MLRSPRIFLFLFCLISLLEGSMVPVDAQYLIGEPHQGFEELTV